jgi:putative ABC transport system substrate-binding protein
MRPFREALRDLGYVEDKNIQIEVRSAQGQDTRLPELAAQLVRSQVDVIVAVQTPGRPRGEECDAQYSHRHDGR